MKRVELSVRFNLDYCQLCCQLLEGRDQPAPATVGEGAEGGRLADTACCKSRKSKAGNRREGSVGGGQELADTAGGRCQASEPIRQAAEDACIVDQGIRHEAEPELGGTADGTAGGMDATPGPLVNRIDHLRLLGNGVVNQTAAKAFATLSARLDRHLKAE